MNFELFREDLKKLKKIYLLPFIILAGGFGKTVEKFTDTRKDYFTDWLKVSIFDRAIRFILVIVGISIGIFTLGGGFSDISISSAWIIPITIFVIFDILFFRKITHHVLSIIWEIIKEIWSIVVSLVKMIFDMIKEIFVTILTIGKEIIMDFIPKKKE